MTASGSSSLRPHLTAVVAGERYELTTVQADTGDYHWNVLWPSALGLAEYLRAHVDAVSGRRTLELGAGVGLVGLVAAGLGATVTLSDVDERALEVAGENVLAHGLEAVTTRVIDWRRPPELQPFECILGSDLVYESWAIEPLANTLEQLLAPGGVVWLSDPIRSTFTEFLDVLRGRGFEFRQDLVEVEHEGRRHTVGVYAIRRRSRS